jgi:hypothetical protein
MARINVKANVTAPAEINVALVRADHASVANIFRLFFEIFLALSSTILGSVLTDPSATRFQFIVLGTSVLLAFVFAIVSYKFGRPEQNS